MNDIIFMKIVMDRLHHLQEGQKQKDLSIPKREVFGHEECNCQHNNQ